MTRETVELETPASLATRVMDMGDCEYIEREDGVVKQFRQIPTPLLASG
jgi:hypothetical protein